MLAPGYPSGERGSADAFIATQAAADGCQPPNLPKPPPGRNISHARAFLGNRETFGLLNHMFSGEVKRWIILMDIFVQCHI